VQSRVFNCLCLSSPGCGGGQPLRLSPLPSEEPRSAVSVWMGQGGLQAPFPAAAHGSPAALLGWALARARWWPDPAELQRATAMRQTLWKMRLKHIAEALVSYSLLFIYFGTLKFYFCQIILVFSIQLRRQTKQLHCVLQRRLNWEVTQFQKELERACRRHGERTNPGTA